MPNPVVSAGAWMLENGHRALLKVTGGRWPQEIMGMKTLELHTTGRKSGERRSTMLTAPILEHDRVILIASKGGHEHHPDWYKNLVADPNVELTIDDITTPWTARTATPEERADLWPRAVAAYKGYEGYQRNTARPIPVVICTPAN